MREVGATNKGVIVRLVAVVATLAIVVAACGSGSGTSSAPSLDPTTDKLGQILARGTLVGYAELNYPPQSIKVDGATRVNPTKCQPNELTASEVTGFDIETHKLVAKALGVEACFVSPQFSEVTAGNWGDRWDIAYASAAINARRMEVLWMTQPYYYIPQVFLVRDDSPAKVPSDLDGKTIGTCTSCTVEAYLQGTLVIPGVELIQKVKDPVLQGFETEFPGIDDLAAGKIDAFLTAEPVAKAAIEEGRPLRILDEVAFSMYPSGLVDKGSDLSEKAFVDRVNEIMSKAHSDGTMKALSMEWFGVDYTTQAGKFDLSSLKQVIE
jgi:polar amino acid transport system substrate-binding protein